MDSLNQTTLNNLFFALDAVYTSQNLLIISKNISSLLNYLTPFSAVKQRGKFEQLLWLDELPSQADFEASGANFESIIVLISDSHQISQLKHLWLLLGRNRKVTLIVKDLSRSFYYTLSRDLFNIHDGLLEKSSEVNLDATLRMSSNVRLLNWRTNPILVEDFVILSTATYTKEAIEGREMKDIKTKTNDPKANHPNTNHPNTNHPNTNHPNTNHPSTNHPNTNHPSTNHPNTNHPKDTPSQTSGLWQYLHNPLQCVSAALDAVMKSVASIESRKDLIKLKNVYAKGDHASLFVNLILNEKFPEYLGKTFSAAERDFFLESLSANADMVVLERNLDYFPLVLSPMTYSGLLSDLNLFKPDGSASAEFYNSTVFANDDIFQNAKDLNFSSIGANLNKLARVLKSEVDTKDNLTDLNEIRKLVSKLGNLKLTQDLIRKHTALSENVLDKIKRDLSSPYSHDFREKWLEAQNHMFDHDYKTQMRALTSFMNGNYPSEVILNYVTLISLINDGIRQKDLDNIENLISLYYGMDANLALASLLRCRIVKVNTRGNDFFGNFSFGSKSAESETTTTSTTQKSSAATALSDSDAARYEDLMLLGITAGQDVYKSTYTLINKFWNLHPVEDDDEAMEDELMVDTIKDYPHPSFTMPAGTVPLLFRMVESLFFRAFLKYKPTNNIYKRPNWTSLNMDTMFKGQTVDMNLEDKSDDRKSKAMSGNGTNGSKRQQYLIVVILGGITRSEISAFKYLQQRLDQKLYIVTSEITNNGDFYEALRVN